jgi:hypothetical protein
MMIARGVEDVVAQATGVFEGVLVAVAVFVGVEVPVRASADAVPVRFALAVAVKSAAAVPVRFAAAVTVKGSMQRFIGAAELRGEGTLAVKSAALSSESSQPSLFRRFAVELLRVEAGPLPSLQVAVLP